MGFVMASNISSSLSFTESPQNKDLPSYKNIAYLHQAPLWKRLKAIATGSWLKYNEDGTIRYTREAEKYLIKSNGEEKDDYEKRLARSPYDNKFGQAIERFTTLSFSNGLEKMDMPFALWHSPEETLQTGFAPLWENIDGDHTDGDLFLFSRFKEALRDGHTYIMVDYANIQPATNLAEYREAADQRRPYWIAIEASNVLNWRTIKINGHDTLVQATVREYAIAADPNSDFGEIEVEHYRVFKLFGDPENPSAPRYVTYQLFRLKQDAKFEDMPKEVRESVAKFENNRTIADFEIIEEGEISIGEIPLYMVHTGNFIKFGESEPSLKALAELNLKLYNNESDLEYIHHLCNVPVLAIDNPNGQVIDDIIISPGKVLNTPSGTKPYWLIPSPVTLSFTEGKIDKIKRDIGFMETEYLKTPSDRQAAFTTTAQLLTIDSTLDLACRNFCDCIKHVLEATGHFLDEGGLSGYIILNPQIDRKSGDPNTFSFFRQLQGDGLISNQTFKNLLKDYGLLPEWYSTARESELMAEEAAIASAGRAPFNPNPDLMKQVADLTLKDLIDKRTALEILGTAGCLPVDVSIDEILERSGDTINLQMVGTYLSQPMDESASQGIGGAVPIDPNRLMTAYSKLASVGSPDAEMLKLALMKYLDSPRNYQPPISKAKPTYDTILKGDPAPRDAKANPNIRE